MKLNDEGRTVNIRTGTLAAALVALLLAVAAVASGCGSTSSDDGVAALEDASATTSEADGSRASNDTESEDPEEAALAWAECMRKNGIDVPDPEVDENGRVRVMIQGRRAADGVQDETFRKAQEECGTPFGNSGPPQLSDAERQEMQDTLLEFAACMREHGVDMPDPQVGSNGEMSFSIGAGPGKLDRSQLQDAQEACQDLMPTGLGKPGDIPQEQRDAMLAFAQCMREHGIDMPDPQFETGGMVMIGGPDEDGAGPKFDPRSEEFQAAEEACGDLLGEMRPGSAPSVQQDGGASGPSTGVQP